MVLAWNPRQAVALCRAKCNNAIIRRFDFGRYFRLARSPGWTGSKRRSFPRAFIEPSRDSVPRAQLSRAEPHANRRIVSTWGGTECRLASLRFHEHEPRLLCLIPWTRRRLDASARDTLALRHCFPDFFFTPLTRVFLFSSSILLCVFAFLFSWKMISRPAFSFFFFFFWCHVGVLQHDRKRWLRNLRFLIV